MVSNAHEKEVTLTVRKAAYITHFLLKMKGQTLNNSPPKIKEMTLNNKSLNNSLYISLPYKNTIKL
jgi:hypothetical protein